MELTKRLIKLKDRFTGGLSEATIVIKTIESQNQVIGYLFMQVHAILALGNLE